MTKDEFVCARKECDIIAERKTHNQKYCSDECCRIATNQRIMEKYYARRDQRQGKERICGDCKITKLSRYNDDNVCSSCKSKKNIELNNSLLDILSSASFAF